MNARCCAHKHGVDHQVLCCFRPAGNCSEIHQQICLAMQSAYQLTFHFHSVLLRAVTVLLPCLLLDDPYIHWHWLSFLSRSIGGPWYRRTDKNIKDPPVTKRGGVINKWRSLMSWWRLYPGPISTSSVFVHFSIITENENQSFIIWRIWLLCSCLHQGITWR